MRTLLIERYYRLLTQPLLATQLYSYSRSHLTRHYTAFHHAASLDRDALSTLFVYHTRIYTRRRRWM